MSETACSRAELESRRPRQNWTGLCLKFTRTMFRVTSRYPSAIEAWEGAGGASGPDTHTVLAPPANVPVFWRGGRYGHVAVSAGGGMCWSTDIRRKGKVDLVPIAEITRKWRFEYLGWSETINGVRIHEHVKA